MARGLQAIDNLIRRLEVVQEVLADNSLVQEILTRNEGLIVALNTESQLEEQGVNALGVGIHTYAPYAPKTVYLKQKKGQPWDRVTLRDTGKFHQSFRLQFTNDGFVITSGSDLTPELVNKYGPNIFGLTPESKGYLIRSIILPELLTEINKRLL